MVTARALTDWPEENRSPPGQHAAMGSRPSADGTIGTSPTGPDELLTADQAGEYLGTGERFIRRLIAEHRIDYVKLGKHVRVQRSILDAFIDSGRIPRVPRTH